jgi:hypothetical protein
MRTCLVCLLLHSCLRGLLLTGKRFGPSKSHSGEIPSLFGTQAKGSGHPHTLREWSGEIAWWRAVPLSYRVGRRGAAQVRGFLLAPCACRRVHSSRTHPLEPIHVHSCCTGVVWCVAATQSAAPRSPLSRGQGHCNVVLASRLGVVLPSPCASVPYVSAHHWSPGPAFAVALRFHAPPAHAGQVLHLGGFSDRL